MACGEWVGGLSAIPSSLGELNVRYLNVVRGSLVFILLHSRLESPRILVISN